MAGMSPSISMLSRSHLNENNHSKQATPLCSMRENNVDWLYSSYLHLSMPNAPPAARRIRCCTTRQRLQRLMRAVTRTPRPHPPHHPLRCLVSHICELRSRIETLIAMAWPAPGPTLSLIPVLVRALILFRRLPQPSLSPAQANQRNEKSAAAILLDYIFLFSDPQVTRARLPIAGVLCDQPALLFKL